MNDSGTTTARDLEALLGALDRSDDQGVVWVGPDGHLRRATAGVRRLVGGDVPTEPAPRWPQLLDLRLAPTGGRLPPERFPLVQALTGQALAPAQVYAGATQRWLRLSAQRAPGGAGALLSVLDVTWSRSRPASPELAALARLTAEVARDFSDCLTAVLGNAELLLERGDLDPEQRVLVDRIFQVAVGAAPSVQRLSAWGTHGARLGR